MKVLKNWCRGILWYKNWIYYYSGSAKEIGKYAFYGCTNLKEVILNEGLEKLKPVHFLI
ncbi:leucine-rich repeat domain-containing protein [Metamycoplasma hominis]|uniref:leucine-rich repeat domain-containing protein n=1 Tax=Metamycoplasma hominis TaxID=2098 RepID=UPI001E5FB5B6|nr:leucine-rich repeat domain-containing protein [Metamycoplasma hominis]